MHINNRYQLLFLLFIVAFVGVAAGCSKFTKDSPAGGGGVATSASPASASASANSAATPTTWQQNATSLNGKEGATMTLACPPNGEPHSVWGVDIYTSDSSICTAGVHMGLITFQQGGTVTIEVRPGRNIYGTSERNGVTSSAYGRWAQSFVFKTPNVEELMRAADEATPVLWNTSPSMAGFEVGKTVKFNCPAGGAGKEGTVWGTDTYTLDSSICTAAVHAGKLQLDSGGLVTIEMRPGESSYRGSTRNGIKTNDYGAYGSSFVVK